MYSRRFPQKTVRESPGKTERWPKSEVSSFAQKEKPPASSSFASDCSIASLCLPTGGPFLGIETSFSSLSEHSKYVILIDYSKVANCLSVGPLPPAVISQSSHLSLCRFCHTSVPLPERLKLLAHEVRLTSFDPSVFVIIESRLPGKVSSGFISSSP